MSTLPPSRSKTIDDLGIDTSVRYAQDQEYLDKTLAKESRYVPSQAQIDVTVPFFSSEFETIFETSQRNKGWAEFLHPDGFREQKKRLFTFQILPSLGSEENYQLQAQRLKERLDKDKEKRKREREKHHKQGQNVLFEEDIKYKEEEKESEKLMRLIEIISNLDKILIEINSRRNQYQKG